MGLLEVLRARLSVHQIVYEGVLCLVTVAVHLRRFEERIIVFFEAFAARQIHDRHSLLGAGELDHHVRARRHVVVPRVAPETHHVGREQDGVHFLDVEQREFVVTRPAAPAAVLRVGVRTPSVPRRHRTTTVPR